MEESMYISVEVSSFDDHEDEEGSGPLVCPSQVPSYQGFKFAVKIARAILAILGSSESEDDPNPGSWFVIEIACAQFVAVRSLDGADALGALSVRYQRPPEVVVEQLMLSVAPWCVR